MKFFVTFLFVLLQLFYGISNNWAQVSSIVPGGDWRDIKGNLIIATEGGIIQVNNLYYLWGMDRSRNNYPFTGVNMYSSPDLKNWTFVNQVLKSSSHADLGGGVVVERAKILYNSKTSQFVMWMHYEGHQAYSIAEVAYATCSTIDGDYKFRSHFRPLNIDSRDLNVYLDDNGKGYLICTTKGNQNVSLFELNDSFTGISTELFRGAASSGMSCEGHAIIKTGGYYFWMMSSCTGWDFNDNHYYYATSLAGPWKTGGNIATKNTHTYESQVGFAFAIKGTQDKTFIYMGDRWSVPNYGLSRIVMLPLVVSGTKLSLPWYDEWDINTTSGQYIAGKAIFSGAGLYKITAKHSGKALQSDMAGTAALQQGTYKGLMGQKWKINNLGNSFYSFTNAATGKYIDVSDASRKEGAKILQFAWTGGYNQQWQLTNVGKDFYRIVNVNTLGKAMSITGSLQSEGAMLSLENFAYNDNQEWSITRIDGIDAVETETGETGINLYYDPSQKQIHFEDPELIIKKIILTDIQGKIVLQKQENFSHSFTMPAMFTASGVYFFHIENQRGTIRRKLFIQ